MADAQRARRVRGPSWVSSGGAGGEPSELLAMSFLISSAAHCPPGCMILIGFPALTQPDPALAVVCANLVGFRIN